MSDRDRRLKSKAGSAKVMWALASSPFPLTVRKLCVKLNLDETSSGDRSAVTTTLSALYDTGMVARRQVPGTGSPYEYAIDPYWNAEDHQEQ